MVGLALATITGTHSLGQTKVWNLDASRLPSGGMVTLIVRHSNGNDVAFASGETAQAPKLLITSGTASLAAKSLNTLSLSPNPASMEIEIALISSKKERVDTSDIYIYDVIGMLVQTIPSGEVDSNGSYRMNVSTLQTGIYFVRTFDENGIPHQKQMDLER